MRTIKTKEDFDNVLNSWYNRTVKLREIAENPHESVERAKKATLLYWQMIGKTTTMIVKSIELRHYKP